MAITIRDAKMLWGRAGSRCSLCRLELAAAGGGDVVGEMAHIVARKPDGPRGDEKLPLNKRDSYTNLILLCPNHHTQIDSDVSRWPVAKLHDAKTTHEDWIRASLDEHRSGGAAMSGSAFVDERVERYASDSAPWYCIFLTPLDVVADAIEPSATNAADLLKEAVFPPPLRLPYGGEPARIIEPSSNGLVFENFSKSSKGVALRVEVFRTGHAEFAVRHDSLARRELSKNYFATEVNAFERPRGMRSHRHKDFDRCIMWKDLAELLRAQLSWIHSLWHEVPLPAADMILTLALTKVSGATLLVQEDPHGFAVGRPHEDDTLRYSVVVDRSYSVQDLAVLILRRCAESFGFLLDDARDDGGALLAPRLPHT